MERVCLLRDHLFLQYRQAVRDWVAAINQLGKSSDDPRLMGRIEDARFRALSSKAAYHNHVREHGCGSFTGSDTRRPATELSMVASGG